MASEKKCCCKGSTIKSCANNRNVGLQCDVVINEEIVCPEGDFQENDQTAAPDDTEDFCKGLEMKKKKYSCGCKRKVTVAPSCNDRCCRNACEDDQGDGGCNDDSCAITQEVLRKLGITMNNNNNDDNDDLSLGGGGKEEGKKDCSQAQHSCGQQRCGTNKWANLPKGEACKSYVQSSKCTPHPSPIDIDNKIVQTVDYPPIEWSRNCPFVSNTTLVCTDLTVKLFIDNPTEFNISGGPLKGCYKMDEAHFHWAEDDDDGSEHTFGGKHYPLEMHVKYHLKRVDEYGAPKKVNLAYFFQISNESNSNMECVCEGILESLRMCNATVRIPNFVLRNLIRKETTEYYTYTGSRTTPPFEQPLQWIIFYQPRPISSSQLSIFREIIPCNRMSIFTEGPTTVYRPSGSQGVAQSDHTGSEPQPEP